MELKMNKTFAILASAAATALSIAAGHAADAPLPPRVNFVTTPASQLQLGMTAQDAINIMGKAARETDATVGTTHISKLRFADAIPGQVVLSDGKVSRVTLDPFRMEKDAFPSFIRPAWPGMASSVVRRALGEPASVLHRQFFGIAVDQWIFSRAGDTHVSVFFRNDRVIAKAAGRGVPSDLFRVDLPSPPLAEGEGPMRGPRVGMTAREIGALYGVARFRVEYVSNGQPSSREVYKVGKGAFVGLTFVDGIVTELETLGGMPDEASFQGL
jgi:hypothetical protein